MLDLKYRETLATIVDRDTSTVFRDFVRASACALSMGSREPEYEAISKRYEESQMDVFRRAFAELVEGMDKARYEDLLGCEYLDQRGTGDKSRRGEFYTPRSLCLAAVKVTMGEDSIEKAKGGHFNVLEPSSGSGNMILAMGEFLGEYRRNLRVTSFDVSDVACDMVFINTTLWGIPARVVHGDSLTMEIWAEHFNIHWFGLLGL